MKFDFTTLRIGPNNTAKVADILQEDVLQWQIVWTHLGSCPSAPWRQATLTIELPPISANDALRAAGSFKTNTSIGVDRFPPKALQLLSFPLVQAIADFPNAIGTRGRWPEAVSDVLMHFTPKPTGGRRPIAVLATVLRVWERVRKPLVREWIACNHKEYD